jgi:serine phosphatase RsbU (regulator of sigma subunit)
MKDDTCFGVIGGCWNADVSNSPADDARLGGDWCDAFATSDDKIALTIGDVVGHGESAAGTMEIMRETIFLAMHDSADPSTVLSTANSAAWARGRVMVTAIAAILDVRLRTLTFANAGHPPPLVMSADGHTFLAHDLADPPLGLLAKHRCASYAVAVPSDALIVLYTDGITEHNRNARRGEMELVEGCRLAYGLRASDSANAIAQYVFQKGRGCDDAALIAVRTTVGPSSHQICIGAQGLRRSAHRRLLTRKAERESICI